MVLWWIGNLLLVLVILPVVIILLNKLLRPAKEIEAYANDILDHGVKLTGALDAVPKLYQTADLVGTARRNVERYGRALERVL
ncbi:MAG: hypothetical protein KY454_07705 [Actinobacteria bacterium]|nr:hypothetical protein [Actinomycetota bacterium]